MFTRTRVAAVAAALVAMAAVPAVADAKLPQLRGVVSGSPYGASGGSMAIPVLFSKMTVRAVGLKSPVGVIILKRSQQVKLPNGAGYSLPVNLRTGDRFKGYGAVSSVNQRTFYPRVPLTKRPAVYFRSKELSLGELTAAVNALQKALMDLQNGSIAAFKDVYAQLADIRKQLAQKQNTPSDTSGGSGSSTDYQAQIDALTKKVNDLIASLPDFSQFLKQGDLPDLSQYAKLTDLSGFITAADLANLVTQQQLADAITAAIGGLGIPAGQTIQDMIDTTVNNLTIPTTTDINNLISTALTNVGLPSGTTVSDAITSALADPNSAVTQAVNSVIASNNLASAADLATANQNISDLTTQLTADEQTISSLQTQVSDLQTQVGNICTALKGANILGLNLGTACP